MNYYVEICVCGKICFETTNMNLKRALATADMMSETFAKSMKNPSTFLNMAADKTIVRAGDVEINVYTREKDENVRKIIIKETAPK